MALLDLSQVTRTLVTLLQTHVQTSPVWPPGVQLTVSPDPPDKLTGDNTLGLYLYHAAEDAHNRNLPPSGSDQPPIRYTPMPLNLYYQLSAHSDLPTPTGAYREQLMMGCALKALHDFPIITDATVFGGAPILAASLRNLDNRLQIELRPVTAEEAVTFWTAGSSPLRLAAYYHVAVVMLEPDESQSRAGRVLTYNVYAFPDETPRIHSSVNTLTFAVPGEAAPREVTVRPAQVPIGGAVRFEGSGLAGDRTALLLTNAAWPAPIAANVAWSVQASSEQVTATVQGVVGGADVLPGVYGAAVRVTRRRRTTDGTVRDFDYQSNESPFVIAPRIDAISPPDGAGQVVVTGRIFQHASLPDDAVQVYVSTARLTGGLAGALGQGEFAVDSPTQLTFRLPAGLVGGQLLALRIFVNGAEAPPNWIVAP